MFISIFTPTYNRAYTLGRLYDSIRKQRNVSFEWIIVDDGSTDETPTLIETWIKSAREEGPHSQIRYFRQKNAGKHVAWNKGLAEARGDIFFPVDSDDYLVEGALECIANMVDTVDDEKIIGVSGVRIFPGNKLTGGKLQDCASGYIDYSSVDRRSKGITGDLAEAFFTDKLRNYPFPVFEDERFVPEAVIFNRFSSDGFLIRGFRDPLYVCEYLADGYTKNVDRLLVSNWKGYSLYLKELLFVSGGGFKAKIVPLCGYLYRFLLKIFRFIR